MTPLCPLRRALADPNLLGGVLADDSWEAWKALLLAAMGEELTDAERQTFTQLTRRPHEPLRRVDELVGVIGRRGGKSRAISVLASYIAALCRHPALARGEQGIVLCVAPDQKQANIILDYVEANFRSSPVLAALLEVRTQRAIKLTNRVSIEVRASDFRRLRGPTYVAAICDEVAFWRTDNSLNPDSEILAAVRPGLATTRGLLVLISSPYARRGELWSLYSKQFGPYGDPCVLVAQAPSRAMNPSLPQSVIDRAYERDPASAAAEYGAEFRRDIEAFVSLEAVRGCVSANALERAPKPSAAYRGFVDPSGGSADSFTLCIGHNEVARQVVVIDVIREIKPPFSPEGVVAEFAALLKSYRVSRVTGDRYGGEWPREQFHKFGILYEPAPKAKSDLYQDALALINSRRIDLLDHPALIQQLVALERRTARSGRDSIDHSPGAHDDIANAVAGCASLLLTKASYNLDAFIRDDDDANSEAAERQAYWRDLGAQVYNYSGGRHWPT